MLHHIRPLNILLAIVAELSIYLTLIQPVDPARDLVNGWQLTAFILFSIGMMTAGYVLNDLYDEEMDRANQRLSPLVLGKINRSQLWKLFAGGQLVTLVAWCYLWQSYDYLAWLWMLWLGPTGLWFYATRLKCSPVAGNLLMAFFAACLPAMFMVGNPGLPWKDDFPAVIRFMFLWYLYFSFGATWFREIVKDLEDYSGDHQANCTTFPVRFGRGVAHRYALLIGGGYGVGVLIFMTMVFFRLPPLTGMALSLLAGMTLAMAWFLVINRDYRRGQQWIKVHLAAGLAMLWIFNVLEVWNG